MRSPTAAAGNPIRRLSREQVGFFEAFGFLHLRGLFDSDIASIIEGFEEVYASLGDPLMIIRQADDFLQQTRGRSASYRGIVPSIVERSDKLRGLPTDPRILGIARSVIGPDAEFVSSDSNVFYSDTSWHYDAFGTPIEHYHIKISFYLDTLRAGSGAIRIIPGSHFHRSAFAQLLQRKLYRPPAQIREALGVEPDEIPAYAVETNPGDVLVWNFRTFHASFHGADRRRSISLMFREPLARKG